MAFGTKQTTTVVVLTLTEEEAASLYSFIYQSVTAEAEEKIGISSIRQTLAAVVDATLTHKFQINNTIQERQVKRI